MLALVLTIPTAAWAFKAYNAGAFLGNVDNIKCSTGLTCTKSGSQLTLVATDASLNLANSETVSNASDDVVVVASDDSDLVFSVYSPLASNGDAAVRLVADASADNGDDWQLLHDGATNDLLFQNDKSGTQATFFSLTEDGDAALVGTTPYLTVGDAGAEDHGIVFDGHSGGIDFNISNDDSVDLLVIGVGTAAGTTDAIRVDANQVVTFVQDVRGLGTDDMSGFLQTETQATATTITAAQCGGTFYNAGAIEMELPEASTVPGCRLTFIVDNASAFTIDPDGGDQIMILTNAAGDSLIADAVGESIVLQARGTGGWISVGAPYGTWTDSN